MPLAWPLGPQHSEAQGKMPQLPPLSAALYVQIVSCGQTLMHQLIIDVLIGTYNQYINKLLVCNSLATRDQHTEP